jgi:hypothetical protein
MREKPSQAGKIGWPGLGRLLAVHMPGLPAQRNLPGGSGKAHRYTMVVSGGSNSGRERLAIYSDK